MALVTVSFNGMDYQSLVTVAEANTALGPVRRVISQWTAFSDEEKAGRIIEASRLVIFDAEWHILTREVPGVKVGVSILAATDEEPEQKLSQLNTGAVAMRFRRKTRKDRLDQEAVQILDAAVASVSGGGFDASDFGEVPQSSFDRYAGQS